MSRHVRGEGLAGCLPVLVLAVVVIACCWGCGGLRLPATEEPVGTMAPDLVAERMRLVLDTATTELGLGRVGESAGITPCDGGFGADEEDRYTVTAERHYNLRWKDEPNASAMDLYDHWTAMGWNAELGFSAGDPEDRKGGHARVSGTDPASGATLEARSSTASLSLTIRSACHLFPEGESAVDHPAQLLRE